MLAYDGTHYFGWQKAKSHPTIQGALDKACTQIFQEEFLSEAASRTDRGVHAKGQVVQILCKKEMTPFRLVRALNANLPTDIRVLSAEIKEPKFHVSLDSLAKTYYYHIDLGAGRDPFLQKTAWHFPYSIDRAKMEAAALQLVGEKDFSAFTTLKTTQTVRNLQKIEIEQLAPHCLRIAMTADRFLYKMARTIVGTLAGIGAGKLDLGVLPTLLQGGLRCQAGMTAPAHGLTLQHIYY